MSNAPYPGYPPSFTVVDTLGDFKRQVWALEICTDDGLDATRMAELEDAIGALLNIRFPEAASFQIVRSDKFDTDLRRAMRVR